MTPPARVPGCPICQRFDAAIGAALAEHRAAARARARSRFTFDVERRNLQVIAARRRHESAREVLRDHLRDAHGIYPSAPSVFALFRAGVLQGHSRAEVARGRHLAVVHAQQTPAAGSAS